MPAGLGDSVRWLDCGLDGAHDSRTKAADRDVANAPAGLTITPARGGPDHSCSLK